MNKQTHDPSRNVDRPPKRRDRQGNRDADREAKRDRDIEQNIDQTVEDSFPASDPPGWTSGSTVVRERKEPSQNLAGESEAVEQARERTVSTQHGGAVPAGGARGTETRERTGGRSRPGTKERKRARGARSPHDEDTLDMTREQPSRADRTPEQRPTGGEGPGKRFEDLDAETLAEQARPHLAPEHTDDRTDLPGRREVTEGPHQPFPGASPAKPVSH